MLYPSAVDGRSLVVLRHRKRLFRSNFEVVACGELVHDGATLRLVTDTYKKVVTDQELADLQIVRPDSKIAECRGFDFFLIE